MSFLDYFVSVRTEKPEERFMPDESGKETVVDSSGDVEQVIITLNPLRFIVVVSFVISVIRLILVVRRLLRARADCCDCD